MANQGTRNGGLPTAGIRDVAERAGVSVGTVSNVFNRPEMVAAGTRLRVQEAVAALRYVRNESARQLRMGQSRTIGLIVPDIANPFFTDLARGVEDVTSAAGALVIMCNSDDDRDKESRYLTMLAEQQVLGVLLVPIASSAASANGLSDRGIPVVLLDYKGRTRRQCSVSVNDRVGGEMAVAHLLSGGRRRVATAPGEPSSPRAAGRRT
jgi:LacI family transcriptional regulator